MKHFRLIRFICLLLILAMVWPNALAYNKLKNGSKGKEVTAMQQALESLGYAITVDGKYGNTTESVVKQFQKKYGLTVDGVAGNKTLTLLYSLVEGNGKRATASPTPRKGATAKPADANTAVVTTSNGGSLNFRAKASTASSVVIYAYIPNGTRVTVVSKDTTWTKISYNGKTGYVMTAYLTFEKATATPTKKATATPKKATATPKASYTTATVKTAKGGSLNLRSAPSSASNNIVTTIPNGSSVVVNARGGEWSQVTYKNKTGYVMSKYLVFASAAPTPTKKPTATPKAVVSNIAYVTTANGKSLNMRSSASSSQNNVIASIPNGTELTLLSKGSTWCQVQYNGRKGYVMTSFLSFPAAATPTPTKKPTATPKATAGSIKAVVNTSNGGPLNLRKSASDQVAVLTTIPNGAEVIVTSKGATWSAVTYNGKSGYVMTKFLYIPSTQTVTNPPATAVPAQADTVFTRILRSGNTGEDVRWVQQKLKALGYTVNVNSYYDSTTIAAVKAFQRQNGLSADGLAGEQTFAILNCSMARRATDTAVSTSTLRIDDTGSGVSSLQSSLKKLGYSVTVNGTYDTDTHNAVVAFQVRNGLVISGIADGLTRAVLASGEGKPYSTAVQELPADAGLIAGPKSSEVQLLHWNNQIKDTVKAGQMILIFDPQTHLSWHITFYSLGRHADSQPSSWRDTQIMNRSFGNTSWAIHPVYVQLPGGQWTMATMHNRPHLYGSITTNGFGGHLCIHFLRTMSEAQANDPDYGVQNQVTLRNAWKALTGETIDY